MTATHDTDTLLSSRELPLELQRLVSHAHQADETKVVSMLSGMVAARPSDDVICSLMVRRHLLVPADRSSIAQSPGTFG
jgi:hypothetical protein